MAEWTNLFDIGPCVVRVRYSSDGLEFETVFYGVVSKGDTVQFAWPGHENELVLYVGSDVGVVNLTSFIDEEIYSGERFSLDVRLSDPVTMYGSRANTINLFGDYDEFTGANFARGIVDDYGDDLFLQTERSPESPGIVFVTPDPAVLTNLDAEQVYIGIMAAKVGV